MFGFSVQIMAYRMLARNQPLSQQLQLAVQGLFLTFVFSFFLGVYV